MILPNGFAVGRGDRTGGGFVSHSIGADSETGCLRTVLTHRPGPELRRLTPRTAGLLHRGGMPWLARAQQEHDALTDLLRDHGVDVIYLTELLADICEYGSARSEAISSVLDQADLGTDLAAAVGRHLEPLRPGELAGALIAGLTTDELRTGRGLVYDLLEPRDFVVEPLPNLVFCRDLTVWIGDQAVVAALPGSRRRESDLLAIVYRHHPRFTAITGGRRRPPYIATGSCLDGGDVVQLGPGVVAVGVGTASTPASVEMLARHLFAAAAADSVLAVPMCQRRTSSHNRDGAANHLDLACTVIDSATVLMPPALAFTLTALTITSTGGELRVSRPRPFLEAAAAALGVDRLTVIDTGMEPMPPGSGQWDDGANALAIGARVIVADERNVATNARLAEAGFTVITVPNSELRGSRGGPRALCAPLVRDPIGSGQHGTDQTPDVLATRSSATGGGQASAAADAVPVGATANFG